MNRQQDHIDALIASFLTGEASPEEIAFLEDWKADSEANRRHFEQFKFIFEHATATVPGETFNADAAWEKVRKKLPGKTRWLSPGPSNGRILLRFAAALALFITVAFFVYRFANAPDSQTLRLASNQGMLSDTLADGSGVFLNRETTVEYTYHPRSKNLTANIVGEAYFDINHDNEKVFIVEAEDTFIKDIGTAFNVRAYPDSNTIEVFVEEGEVVFYTADNPGISVKANTRGVYYKDNKTFAIADSRPNITSYKSKVFTFNNQSLIEVVQKLNEVYGTRIEIGEKLKGCRITVSFNNESIDEISEIIAETLGLSLSKSQNTITLKGDGCTEAVAQ
ncbi:MAG TPA: FecR domain-containing protein [Chryseosolibacter sp.]|nr:FecR domain-containing protein [Chryseosolibacter sp.]